MEDIKNIAEQELDEVVGGGMHYHMSNEAKYNAAGVETDWCLAPWEEDKFAFKGTSIDSMTAVALVFYANAHCGEIANNADDAIIYREEHMDEYHKFLDNNIDIL